MSGELNMPYEDVPGGPFQIDVDVLPCGGVLVRSAVSSGGRVPALLFDFYLADGKRLPCIALVMAPDEMLALLDVVRGAGRSAVREARAQP